MRNNIIQNRGKGRPNRTSSGRIAMPTNICTKLPAIL